MKHYHRCDNGDHDYQHHHDNTTKNHATDQDRNSHIIMTTAGLPVIAKTNHPNNNKGGHKGRVQLLFSALALCVTGVVHHMKKLPSLSTTRATSHRSGYHHFVHPDLFIPSMDFSIMSQLTSNNYNSRYRGQYPVDQIWNCTKKAKELQWEWYNLPPSTTTGTSTSDPEDTKTTNTNSKTTPQLLIAVTSGYDKYAEMLALSAHLAKVYAHTHNATVVVLQGTALAPDGCTGPTWFSTINKIRLLFAAIDRSDQYDQLLLLEADTLMVNMDVDIRTLLTSSQPLSSSSLPPSDFLIAAQPVRQGDSRTPPERHQIHAGITLWNLHHAQCKIVALQWFEEAKKAISKGTYWGDERYLQAILQRQNQDIIQWLDNDEFAYEEGTIVKHFFSHASSWSERKRRMEQVATSVCEKYDCTVVPRKEYDAIA